MPAISKCMNEQVWHKLVLLTWCSKADYSNHEYQHNPLKWTENVKECNNEVSC